MNFRELKYFVLVAFFAIAAVSCKKNEDTTTYPSLVGLSFECPSFVSPNQVVKMTPKGVEHPDGKGIGYYWKVTPTMSLADTVRLENGLNPDTGKASDGSFTHKFSDTLSTYSVTCYAFADGYSNTSYQIDVKVVEGGLNKSVTKTGILETDIKITSDGVDYYYTEAAGLHWLRNNIATIGSGAAYGKADITSNVFGRYYSYDEAVNICPEGWRLPTDNEWVALCTELGAEPVDDYANVKSVAAKLFVEAEFNGDPMLEYWPAVGQITNSSRLSLLPVGLSNLGVKSSTGEYKSATFEGMNEYAVVWTADKVSGESDMAYYRYLIADQPDFYVGKANVQSFGASVRCVREAE